MNQRQPKFDWDELHASSSFREMFRYKKAGRLRIYNLRAMDDTTVELWVVTGERGKMLKSRRLVTFENPAEAPEFLQEIEKELRSGGWTEV